MATKQSNKETNTDSIRDPKTKRVIQKLPEHLIHSDLEYLEIVGTPEIVERAINYLKEVLPDLQTTFHDFIQLIGLKANTHSAEMVYLANQWRVANEVTRETWLSDPKINITLEKVLIFEEIIQADKEKGMKLLELILSLAQLWGVKDKNGKISKSTMAAFTIISESIGVPLPVIQATDYTISAEIFAGIIFKPADAWDKCFFLKRVTASLTRLLSL